MSLAGWIVIGVMAVMFVVDWLIVMGTNPRKWKGGDRHEGDGPDREV